MVSTVRFRNRSVFPFPQSFSISVTCPNRTLPPVTPPSEGEDDLPPLGPAPPPAATPESPPHSGSFGSDAASTVSRHPSPHLPPSENGTSNFFAMPLSSTVALPNSTNSCGNDATNLMGLSSDSSLVEYPPGKGRSASPNRNRATAHARSSSSSFPSVSLTPKDRTNSATFFRAADLALVSASSVVWYASTASTSSASWTRWGRGRALNWPQSISETLPPSPMKIFPG
mmetsp:Transcript_10263/g.19704  ORF Transcript_10263/g.19704 Transcript_10263/m.19704 type:complete len:228 (-) Transcript_10263:531-1214(-)